MEQEICEIHSNQRINHTIIYNERWRHYMLQYIYHERGNDICCYIKYCPWCGNKLPKELSEEWWDALEKEYGITDPRNKDKNRVPAEFWTDEWWKKRGL